MVCDFFWIFFCGWVCDYSAAGELSKFSVSEWCWACCCAGDLTKLQYRKSSIRWENPVGREKPSDWSEASLLLFPVIPGSGEFSRNREEGGKWGIRNFLFLIVIIATLCSLSIEFCFALSRTFSEAHGNYWLFGRRENWCRIENRKHVNFPWFWRARSPGVFLATRSDRRLPTPHGVCAFGFSFFTSLLGF